MIKSIKRIVITLILLFLLIFGGIVYPYITGNPNKYATDIDRKTNITVCEDGTIICEENIIFYTKGNHFEIPFIISETIVNEESTSTWRLEQVLIDGKNANSINQNFNGFNYSVNRKDEKINFFNADELEDKKHELKIIYKYDSSTVLLQYDNITNFSLRNFSAQTLNIKLPNSNMILKDINGNSEIEKNDEYWQVSLNKGGIKTLGIEGGVIENSQKIDSSSEKNKQFVKQGELPRNALYRFIFLLCASLEILIAMILYTFTNKRKYKKYYERESSNVIEPIIAEAIIDKKIGTKELIMTTISDLIVRGNLECINNDTIKLIHKKDLKTYEKKIIDLVFKNKEKIEFVDIKNIFIKDNENTEKIYIKIKEIKQIIFERIIELGIYDYSKKRILKIMKFITSIIYIELFVLLFSKLLGSLNIKVLIPIHGMALIFVGVGKLIGTIKKHFEETNLVSFFFNFFLILFGVTFLLVMQDTFEMLDYTSNLLWLIILFIVNTLIRKQCDTHVFSEYGKKEFEKCLALKAYIKDYSLMEERELESTILWDDYLTYSIAFGISNKVTKRFGEELLNANISLQKLDKILRL